MLSLYCVQCRNNSRSNPCVRENWPSLERKNRNFNWIIGVYSVDFQLDYWCLLVSIWINKKFNWIIGISIGFYRVYYWCLSGVGHMVIPSFVCRSFTRFSTGASVLAIKPFTVAAKSIGKNNAKYRKIKEKHIWELEKYMENQ